MERLLVNLQLVGSDGFSRHRDMNQECLPIGAVLLENNEYSSAVSFWTTGCPDCSAMTDLSTAKITLRSEATRQSRDLCAARRECVKDDSGATGSWP
jgi:hypothetical protein